jgi:amino acid transporter
MGVIHWKEAGKLDKYLVSGFMEKLYGHQAGVVVTILILCIAMSSLFAVILGYSRVPYAAAVDGNFFKIFARLHPTKNFPHISLLVLCGAGFLFSMMFKLSEVITAILAMRIIVQFMAQSLGIVLLRKRNGTKDLPFKMWLYPVPVILSVVIWLFLFYNTGWFAFWGGCVAILGIIVFYISRNKLKR